MASECEACGCKYERPAGRLVCLCDFCLSRARCEGLTFRLWDSGRVSGGKCGAPATKILATSPRCEACYADAKRAQARVFAALAVAS